MIRDKGFVGTILMILVTAVLGGSAYFWQTKVKDEVPTEVFDGSIGGVAPAPIEEEPTVSAFPTCLEEVRCIPDEAVSTERKVILADTDNADVLPGYADGSEYQFIFESINSFRFENGLTPLVRNRRLDYAASLKRDDMAINGYFAHESPAGLQAWDYMDIADYKYTRAAENLSKEIIARDVVSRWMASPTHRANILLPDITEMGLEIQTDYIVLLLGSRDN